MRKGLFRKDVNNLGLRNSVFNIRYLKVRQISLWEQRVCSSELGLGPRHPIHDFGKTASGSMTKDDFDNAVQVTFTGTCHAGHNNADTIISERDLRFLQDQWDRSVGRSQNLIRKFIKTSRNQ